MSIYYLQGGADKPYPFNNNCWQGCNLGPQYAHAQTGGVVNLYFPITDFGSSSGFAQYSSAGFYPPETLYVSPTGSQIGGQYWNGYYGLSSGSVFTSGGALPATVWSQPQTLTAITLGTSGTGFTVGTLTPTNGIVIPESGSTASISIDAVDGSGRITAAHIVSGGLYLSGHTPTTWAQGSTTGDNIAKTYGNATMNLNSDCQKRGFKNVAAQRQWHGRLGYIDGLQSGLAGTVAPGTACFVAGSADPGPAGFTGFASAPYQSGIPSTHYCEQDIEISTVNYPGGGASYTGTYKSHFSVNPLSGENTLIASQDSYSGGGGATSDPTLTYYDTMGNPFEWITEAGYNSVLALFASNQTSVLLGTYTGTAASYTHLNTDGVTVVQDGGVSESGGVLTGTINVYAGLSGGGTFTQKKWTVTLSNTSIVYSFKLYGETSPGVVTLICSSDVSSTLSSPYTSTQLYNDCVGLLAWWDLSNDLQYPWRTDGYPSIMPLVKRNEILATQPIISFDTAGGWVDGAVRATIAGTTYLVYDGTTIIGKPEPAGYINYWDFNFIGTGTVSGEWVTQSFGYPVTGVANVQLPLNATHWTNDEDTAGIPPGASAIFDDWGGSPIPRNCDLRLVKWAQCVEKWPAQNWNYAGDAKFYIDETAVICSPGGTLASAIPSAGLYAVVSGSALTGIYHFNAGDTTTAAGTLVYHAPSNWWTVYSARQYPDTQDFVAPIRQQAGGLATAPSLLGRAGVTPAGGSGPYTFTFGGAQANFALLVSGGSTIDHIDLYDANMGLLAANVTATRVDDSNFYTVANYPTAAWVMIHGDPNPWYMNSGYPRGNFVALEWTNDNRTPGEITRMTGKNDCSGAPLNPGTSPAPLGGVGYMHSFSATQRCLSNLTCAPRVMCWSPNGEVFPNGYTIGFTAPAMDPIYGGSWWGMVMDTMTDEYWQPSHSPCDGSGLRQDDGSCATTDPTANCALEPIVEAELHTPGYGVTGTENVTIPGFVSLGVKNPTTDAGGVLPPSPNSGAGSWITRGYLMAHNPCGTFDYGWFLP